MTLSVRASLVTNGDKDRDGGRQEMCISRERVSVRDERRWDQEGPVGHSLKAADRLKAIMVALGKPCLRT